MIAKTDLQCLTSGILRQIRSACIIEVCLLCQLDITRDYILRSRHMSLGHCAPFGPAFSVVKVYCKMRFAFAAESSGLRSQTQTGPHGALKWALKRVDDWLKGFEDIMTMSSPHAAASTDSEGLSQVWHELQYS